MKRIIIVFMLTGLLIGCSSGGGSDEPATFNIAGEWEGTGVCTDDQGNPIDLPTGDNPTNTVRQDGNQITWILESGIQLSGTLNGDMLHLEGDFNVFNDTCHVEIDGTVLNNNHIPIVQNITCSDGTAGFCTGDLFRQ